MVSALVLAAGCSRRMGVNKLLLEVGGKPVIHRVLDALLAADLDRIFLVTGFQRQALMRLCESYSCRVQFVHNRQWAAGRSSSIRSGLRALEADPDGVLVIPGDVPLVDTELITALLDAFREKKEITFPLVGKQKGHPVIFPREKLSLLQSLKGEQTLHRHLLAGGEGIHPVPWHSSHCLLDVDTPRMLHLVRREWEKSLGKQPGRVHESPFADSGWRGSLPGSGAPKCGKSAESHPPKK